jgi:hypothetical protein
MGLPRYRRLAVAQRLIVAASLLAFLAATIGVPVLFPRGSHKDRSQPYPCMNHSCGCASAEACWRSCCCFTNVEKLAWAAKHGVTPPQYVFAAATREKFVSTTGSCCQTAVKSCCAPKKSYCHVLNSPTHDDYDQDKHAHNEHSESDSPEPSTAQDSWKLDFISAVQARRCQGQAELWLALGAVAPPPAHIELQLTQTICGHVANFSPSLAGISLSPATPPPRA